MAIKGNLQNFSITQLLNLINLAQKTGTLVVEGPIDTARISFSGGKLAYSRLEKIHDTLDAVLYRAKKLSRAQHRLIASRSSDMSDKELGLLLINANYISQEDVLASLRLEFISVLDNIVSWDEGNFRFDDNIMPPGGKITLEIGLENIIMEGVRRLREWQHLRDELPSLEVALNFADRPGSNLRNINLSVKEWRVVSYINPKNSIQQIANTIKMDDLEIRQIVYGLLQAGLIELVRSEAIITAERKNFFSSNNSNDEQKSLVTRIINRIKSL